MNPDEKNRILQTKKRVPLDRANAKPMRIKFDFSALDTLNWITK